MPYNQPSLKPICCPMCGKLLLKPTEMGDVVVKCEDCNKMWRVEIDINWRYWTEYKKNEKET